MAQLSYFGLVFKNLANLILLTKKLKCNFPQILNKKYLMKNNPEDNEGIKIIFWVAAKCSEINGYMIHPEHKKIRIRKTKKRYHKIILTHALLR